MIPPPLLALAALVQAPADTARQGRPCTVAIDRVGHDYRQVPAGRGHTNAFAGGGVKAHCEGTNSTLDADSVAWYSELGRFDMIGNVKIRDSVIALDARFASYHVRREVLEAHNTVVAVNRLTGTVLRGPNLRYSRAAQGIRDTTEMYATARPTIEYRQHPDSGEPYIVVADRARMQGDDRMWGGGRVTIDRSDFAARADSIALDQTAGWGVLLGGPPRVEGRGDQRYALVGRRIDLALERREVKLVKALGAGQATGEDWTLTADTIHLAIERRKLQQAFAWGDSARPHAVSTEHTVQADSLALDAPDQTLKEIRAFGRAFSTSRADSAADSTQVDWIAGDTIVASFEQARDSAGDTRSELRRLVAHGAARALTYLRENGTNGCGPSRNYSRGERITIAVRGDRLDQVVVSGSADGVHLEPLCPAPADTSKPRVGR